MPSFFDVARQIAAQNADTEAVKLKNYGMREELPYIADKSRLANELTKGQISEIPYNNYLKSMQAKRIPSEIEQNMALAAYHRAETGMMPTKAELERLKMALEQRKIDQEYRKMNGSQSTYGKAIDDYAAVEQKYGPDSPITKQFRSYLQTISQPKAGITAYDPTTGNPLVQIGGGRGGRGGPPVLMNPGTGNVTMPLTPAQTNLTQQSIMAVDRAMPQIKKMLEGYTPYLGAGGKAQKYADQTENLTGIPVGGVAQLFTGRKGTRLDRLSNYGIAEGKSNTSPESLLKSVNIPATIEALKMMRESLIPRDWDNAETYLARIKDTLVSLKTEQGAGKGVLRGGLPIGNIADTTPPEPEAVAPAENPLGSIEQEMARRGIKP